MNENQEEDYYFIGLVFGNSKIFMFSFYTNIDFSDLQFDFIILRMGGKSRGGETFVILKRSDFF